MRALFFALLCAVLVGTSACGLDDAARDAANEVASDARQELTDRVADAATARVSDAVERVLSEAGYTLEIPPSCSGDLDGAGIRLQGRVECTGEVSSGESYEAVFDGVLSLRGRCPGALTVEVDGESQLPDRRVDVCRIARLLNGLG